MTGTSWGATKGWETRRALYGENGRHYKPDHNIRRGYMCRECETYCGVYVDYGTRPYPHARPNPPTRCVFNLGIQGTRARWVRVDDQ